MKRPGVPPFIELLEPLIATARKQTEYLRAASEGHIAAEAWLGAERSLLQRLAEVAGPALLGAFRAETPLPPVARLTGVTPDWAPRTRYADFLARGIDGWPPLAQRLHRVVDAWRSAVSALAGHLASDDRALRRWHRSWRDGVPAVTAIEPGLSDPHAGGRTVVRLTFADGRSLAYKPRSLAAEAAFGRLLRRVSGQSEAPQQRIPQVLDRGDHGWMEWLTPEPCRNQTEVEAFFERCGGLLAMQEMLRGGDIHPDNLIAAGPYPAIVDLECLFQPAPADLGRPDPLEDPAAFTSGALPVFTSFDGGRTLHAIAAFGAGPPPKRPDRELRHPGTDWIHLAPNEVDSFDANGPSLGGVALDVRDHADALIRGYRATLAVVLERRDALLAPRGALRRFRRTTLRLLCAPTNLYALVLDSALGPEGVRDEDCFRTRLARAAGREPLIADRRCWSAVLAEEVRALDRLDVPAFVFKPAQRSARAAGGGPIGRVFAVPMFERVERDLRALDQDGLDDRAAILRAVLRRSPEPLVSTPEASEPAAADARTALRRLADRVADLAVPQSGGAVTWVRLWEVMPAPVAPVGSGLCYGAAGIALFLAEAGRVLADEVLIRLAVGALTPVRDRLRQGGAARHAATVGPGYGRGIGGTVAALSWCAGLLEMPALLDDARTLADATAAALGAGSAVPDMMDGAAGLALGLSVLRRHRPQDGTLTAALTACGTAILQASRTPAPGLRDWPDRRRPGQAGLSHGAAGIATALAHIHAETGDPAWASAATEAVAYEDTLFDPNTGNWRRQGPGVTVTWCHGAPGIALTRLALQRLLPSSTAGLQDGFAAALATTRRTCLDEVDDLCCGEAGRIGILATLAQARNDAALRQEAEAALHARLPDWTAGRARLLAAGAAGAPEDPSLFRGLAGLGHALVQHLAPELAADVLLPA